MLSSGSRATAQGGDPTAEPPALRRAPCSMQCQGAAPSPPCAFLLRLALVALHLQASHLGWVSPADGLNPCLSAFLAGWSGWRKHRKLPLLPAPLHGAVAQRGQVQRHHGGHDQVRRHHGPALCQQWGETPLAQLPPSALYSRPPGPQPACHCERDRGDSPCPHTAHHAVGCRGWASTELQPRANTCTAQGPPVLPDAGTSPRRHRAD